jgi:hypothetical protein
MAKRKEDLTIWVKNNAILFDKIFPFTIVLMLFLLIAIFIKI